jgi:hypothetical protein
MNMEAQLIRLEHEKLKASKSVNNSEHLCSLNIENRTLCMRISGVVKSSGN